MSCNLYCISLALREKYTINFLGLTEVTPKQTPYGTSPLNVDMHYHTHTHTTQSSIRLMLKGPPLDWVLPFLHKPCLSTKKKRHNSKAAFSNWLSDANKTLSTEQKQDRQLLQSLSRGLSQANRTTRVYQPPLQASASKGEVISRVSTMPELFPSVLWKRKHSLRAHSWKGTFSAERLLCNK